MQIVLLASQQDGILGWEEQFGQREGHFSISSDGGVVYRHPSDERVWFAGVDELQFRAAAGAWNTYSEAAASVSDMEQEAVLRQLHEAMLGIGVLAARPDSFWTVLLEQAEAGML